jgi:hypothetical protein
MSNCKHSHCDHSRKMSLYMKHNDLASLSIPHLKIDRDDYLPSVGILGGDDTQFTVCMECGQITDWKPITDAEIKLACRNINDEGDDEDEIAEQRKQERKREEPIVVQPNPKFQEVQDKLEKELVEQFGAGWRTDRDVREFLLELTDIGQNGYIRLAARRLLGE